MSSTQSIELEVNLRLRELLINFVAAESWTEEFATPYLRLAYATGYQDALSEACRGQMFPDLGLPVPRRAGRRRRSDPTHQQPTETSNLDPEAG